MWHVRVKDPPSEPSLPNIASVTIRGGLAYVTDRLIAHGRCIRPLQPHDLACIDMPDPGKRRSRILHVACSYRIAVVDAIGGPA
jgi:hypothetical protein